ncbi:uncharacterized protein T551_00574 [Pneumocystis jirovecii RU7]|uniref:Uncharacterized protein n=1 Tax=Pneumocystis jirovecii (strain RU7) TaxID=1408657 RepID=A0A0W4ZVU0_PNEJ7|nr:uncharacterized protein T551_00574 [Pneumocystis jirovecii RU7]KTW32484.1 hypothetical protein T551_00574 [Pneumocystis jirovecii RU7]
MEDKEAEKENISRGKQDILNETDSFNKNSEKKIKNTAENERIEDNDLLENEERNTEIAEEHKLNGNRMFRQAFFDAAVASYQKALDISSPNAKSQRAIYHANIAACYIQKELWDQAVDACTQALKEDPSYVKAMHRRAQANEKIATWSSLNAALLGKILLLESASINEQKDYESIEKDLPETSPILESVKESISRLKPKLSEAQEKEKAQMLNQLKTLGNSILGKFGLSTDNFKVTKDPQTGGYSISFQN